MSLHFIDLLHSCLDLQVKDISYHLSKLGYSNDCSVWDGTKVVLWSSQGVLRSADNELTTKSIKVLLIASCSRLHEQEETLVENESRSPAARAAASAASAGVHASNKSSGVNGRRQSGQMALSFSACARQSEQKKWPQLVTVRLSAGSVQIGHVYMSSCSVAVPARHRVMHINLMPTYSR